MTDILNQWLWTISKFGVFIDIMFPDVDDFYDKMGIYDQLIAIERGWANTVSHT